MSHLAYYDQSNRNPVVPHCFSDLPAAVDVAADDVGAVDVAAAAAAAAGRVDWNTSSAIMKLYATVSLPCALWVIWSVLHPKRSTQ